MLGQFTTPGPSFCPAGYSLIPGAQTNVIPSSPTAAQLSAEQAAMCQNASGQALEDVQGTPLGIALLVGAGLAVLFLPGLWKIVALPMAFEGYCSMNNQKCIVSL